MSNSESEYRPLPPFEISGRDEETLRTPKRVRAVGFLLAFVALFGVSLVAIENGRSPIHAKNLENHQAVRQTLKLDESPQEDTTSPTVTVPGVGDIQGTKVGNIYEYKGIKYATAKRFGRAHLKWGPVSRNEGKAFGPVCFQRANGPLSPYSYSDMSEDCLYLNIYTPHHHTFFPHAEYPVMFWVHGGAFKVGAGSSFDGKELASRGVVVVTINYRLGVLGFYSPPKKLSLCAERSCLGMNGIHDQIVALRWVRSHIGYFGGSRDKITIFGESAGGTSVCAMIFSEMTVGLFDKVIIESGACNGPWGPVPTLVGDFMSLWVDKVYAKHRVDLFDEKTSGQQIMEYQNKTFLFPSVDNFVLKHTIAKHMETSTWNGNHYMIGSNSRDGLTGLTDWILVHELNQSRILDVSEPVFKFLVAGVIILEDSVHHRPISIEHTATAVADLYKNTVSTVWQQNWYAWNSDMCLACPSRTFASVAAGKGKTVYLYDFFGAFPPYEAYHGSELSSVFGLNPNSPAKWFEKVPGAKYNATLSHKVQAAWTNFAKFGDPTNATEGVDWPAYDTSTGSSGQNGDNIKGISFTRVPKFRATNSTTNGPSCLVLDQIFGSSQASNADAASLKVAWKHGIPYVLSAQSLACLMPFALDAIAEKMRHAVELLTELGGQSHSYQLQNLSEVVTELNATSPHKSAAGRVTPMAWWNGCLLAGVGVMATLQRWF